MRLTTSPLRLKTAVSGDHFSHEIKENMGDDYAIIDKLLPNGNYQSEINANENGATHEFQHENGDESDGSEYNYGPGIVNRLKEKFITLFRDYASHISPVRRVASLEQLLDVEKDGERPMDANGCGDVSEERPKYIYEKNANGMRKPSRYSNVNKALKRARSMDNVCDVNESHRNSQKQLRNVFLTSKKIIIIERPKPTVKSTADTSDQVFKIGQFNNKVENRKKYSSCAIDELPIPNKVRECMKVFEHQDENKNIIAGFNVPNVTKIQLNKTKEAFSPKSTKVVDEMPTVEPPRAANELADSSVQPRTTKVDIKSRVDIFSGNSSKSQQLNSSARAIDMSITEKMKPRVIDQLPKCYDQDPAVCEMKSVPNRDPDVVNGLISYKLRCFKPLAGSSSVLIRVTDDKPRHHLPNINPDLISDCRSQTNKCRMNDEGCEVEENVSADHTMEVLDFIGANVIVGRSSLLKTRNKKLQILFDDKAVSTYEYPSEWALMSEKSDSDDDNCVSDPSGSQSGCIPPTAEVKGKDFSRELCNYTPLAVANDQVFQLGISGAFQPAVQSKPNSDESKTQDENYSTISLKQVDDKENVKWSNAQTSDILF